MLNAVQPENLFTGTLGGVEGWIPVCARMTPLVFMYSDEPKVHDVFRSARAIFT